MVYSINIDYLFSYGDYGWMPQYLQEYARAQLPPMYRILIAGDFTSYNETRRMGLTRLNPDGSVDTSFLDTAFNQFAGLNRGTTTQATGLINSIAISSDQPPGNENDIIGLSFKLDGLHTFDRNDLKLEAD